eukprot:8482516-Pyramimonas_sp.AAC.1
MGMDSFGGNGRSNGLAGTTPPEEPTRCAAPLPPCHWLHSGYKPPSPGSIGSCCDSTAPRSQERGAGGALGRARFEGCFAMCLIYCAAFYTRPNSRLDGWLNQPKSSERLFSPPAPTRLSYLNKKTDVGCSLRAG